jgi:transmembrane sensor
MDRGSLSEADDRELQTWLTGDVRRLGALARMRAISLHTERAKGFSTAGHMAEPVPQTFSRRFVLSGGAGVAAAAGAAGWFLFGRTRRFDTRKGELRIIPLEDGSVVTLNTASRIQVNYRKDQRNIVLLAGEAMFDVAKDPARPFNVQVSGSEVRAVGTSFTVRRMATGFAQVLVREGVVEVRSRRNGISPVRLKAYRRIDIDQERGAGSAADVTAPELERDLAWREGRIAFEGQRLDGAAAEFSRYSDIRIVVADPQLAREEIAGLFQANDPIGFAQAIAVSLDARAQVKGNEVVLTR